MIIKIKNGSKQKMIIHNSIIDIILTQGHGFSQGLCLSFIRFS